MTDDRRDRHAEKRTTVRIPNDVKEAAHKALVQRGWTLNDFIAASLALVAQNPDATLKRLTQLRPPPRVGRPKKKHQAPPDQMEP